MTQLQILAQQYQQALDGLTGINSTPHSERAGAALLVAMEAELASSGAGAYDWAALQSVVLQTTLAASIVSYWERIPWATLTPQMLSGPGRPILASLRISSSVMMYMCSSGLYGGSQGSVAIPTAALLLRQVCTCASLRSPLTGRPYR